MNFTSACLAIVKEFEGLRLDAYIDPVGIPTIGYGTIRYPDGRAVQLGDSVTEAEAEALLLHECADVARDVADMVEGVPANQNQFDALVSFCYNLGAGALLESTLLRKLKASDAAGAASEFDRWVKGTVRGEKVTLAGLVRRRRKERDLFESSAPSTDPMPKEKPSSAELVTALKGFRKNRTNFVVGYGAGGAVVEILELSDSLADTIAACLAAYPKAGTFDFAAASEPLPAGDVIQFSGLDRPLPKVRKPPKLDRKLLILGAADTEENQSSDVRNLQARLKELGYYKGEVSGLFGMDTDEAAKAFQADHFGRAEADGRVGPKTWAKLWGEAKPTEPAPGSGVAGRHYLQLTRTSEKDRAGCVVLLLAYYRDGMFVDSIEVVSGIPSRQNFRIGDDSDVGSNEPLPEGLWSLHNIEWKDGIRDNYSTVWSNALGPAKIRMDYVKPGRTSRSAIEIHIDWNKATAPGTAGCIGVQNVNDFRKLVAWLRETDPRDLFVDWDLGTCPKP